GHPVDHLLQLLRCVAPAFFDVELAPLEGWALRDVEFGNDRVGDVRDEFTGCGAVECKVRREPAASEFFKELIDSVECAAVASAGDEDAAAGSAEDEAVVSELLRRKTGVDQLHLRATKNDCLRGSLAGRMNGEGRSRHLGEVAGELAGGELIDGRRR